MASINNVQPTTNLTGHLPGELIEVIIGYLPDRQSIKTCALISRAWVPWTRVQLFRQIKLEEDNLYSLLVLLQSPYCTFPRYVRYIDVRALQRGPMSRPFRQLFQDVFRGPHTWLDQENTIVEGSLLRRLYASATQIVEQRTSSHIMNLICLFPAVEHLCVCQYVFHFKVGKCSALPPMPRTLKSLILTNGIYPSFEALPQQWRNFIEWIRHQEVFEICKLYLDVMWPYNMDGIEALLRARGTSLRHLHIGPSTSRTLFFYFGNVIIMTNSVLIVKSSLS
jgi:hypothetical protein